MIKMRGAQAIVLGGAALLIAGCGPLAPPGAHGTGSATARTAPRTTSAAPTVPTVGWRHLQLPAGWDIRGILGGSGGTVTLVLRDAPTQAHPAGGWATAPYRWATGVVGAVAPAASDPAPSSTLRYRLVSRAGGPPVILGGRAPVAWPAAIPTYTSGENPAAHPFGVDNALVGQSGPWLWAALKGPHHSPAAGLAGVWGWRRWDRLVALNRETGQYVVYPIPADWSASLDGPLWEHPPVYHTLLSGQGLVAVGHWAAVLPAHPASGAPLPVRGAAPPTASEQEQALALIHQQAWASINADAAFWNCYVMSDPSTAACPHGRSVFGSTALSTQPTYYNHGDVGFSLLWAATLPLETAARQQARAADEALLAKGLSGSYLMPWIGNPSASALRARFGGQPPYRLPGYTRRGGYYWASGSSG